MYAQKGGGYVKKSKGYGKDRGVLKRSARLMHTGGEHVL